jgi:hypothetical protein
VETGSRQENASHLEYFSAQVESPRKTGPHRGPV